MKCSQCGNRTKVHNTKQKPGQTIRYRYCRCGFNFKTTEVPTLDLEQTLEEHAEHKQLLQTIKNLGSG